MMVQIFLSYAREDEKQVEALYQKLSATGFTPWMDKKDILPGEVWESSIRRAIRGSDFFVACLSANAVGKRGFLQKEIKDALDIWQEKLEDDIYLIPARLHDCEVPQSLHSFQWVNLFEEGGWAQLVKAIQVGMERRGKVIKSVEVLPEALEEERLPRYPSLADVHKQLQTLKDGIAALTDQLLNSEKWRQPEVKPTPQSLAAFVSLDEREREAAVQSVQLANDLGDAQKQLYAQVLVGMLQDESYLVVWEAVKSLQHVDTPLAIEPLLQVCRTRSDQIVYRALEALGQVGDGDTMFALEELKTLMEDLPLLQQTDEEEERQTFLQAVGEAIQAVSERLRPSGV